MSITEVAIKRPLLIVVIFTVLILFGAQSYFSLNYNLLPDLQIKNITVSTIYPGASASEVETSVTKKLEDMIASTEGLDQIIATSQQGVSIIKISLKSTADVDEAEDDIQRKINQGENDLPDEADKPVVKKVNLDETPVLQAGITSTKIDNKTLYDLVDNQLKPILQNISGVGQLNIIGGEQREIQVKINLDALNHYGLNIYNVLQAISKANVSFPAGSIETRKENIAINYDANLVSVAQLRDIVIAGKKASTLHLSDIAQIIDGTEEPKAISRLNGIPSIGVQIIKQGDANAVEVSASVKKEFKRLEDQYQSQGIRFSISTDQSEYTLAAADAVMEDLGLAILIVGIVMLAFLHSVRSSMFVLVALPSSIIPTFIAMYLCGFSLNLMTLMAMSLVVGILVDDSIVVLENIYRHLEMGTEKRKAALEGRNEIGFTALAITLVDVVVFLPLALAGGIIGDILREFSLVIVFSTLMSLFVSFTLTPLLASRFGKLETLNKDTLWGKVNLAFEEGINHLKAYYGSLLQQVLHKKRWFLSGVFIVMVGAVLLIKTGFIGATFIPVMDQSQLLIRLELAPEASLYQTNIKTNEAEALIEAYPEVVNVFSSVGFVTGSVSGASGNQNEAEITVSLSDKGDRDITPQEFGLKLKEVLSKKLTGVKISILNSSITGGGSSFPIQVSVEGINLEEVREVAEKYRKIVAEVPGTESVQFSVKDPKPEINIKLDREKMSQLNIDAAQVGSVLQVAFNGNDDNTFRQDGNEYNILVRLDEGDRMNKENIKHLHFQNSNGQSFALTQFAEVEQGIGESVLQRTDRMNAITVNSGAVGRPSGTIVEEIKEKAKNLDIPDGIRIKFLGDAKNQAESFQSLIIVLITGIVLVYLIMVALYDNAIYPFVVLFSIPVALIGALLALALSMETLNVFSIIGCIMLMGLVAKNAILIVDFTNQLKTEGHNVKEALIEAGKERLRPILMTTLAMILGMLPLALSSAAGAEIKNGMAWVIIGGLTSSMILTLFVVPSVYLIVEHLIHKKKNL